MYKTEDEDLQWQEAKSFESSVRSPVNLRPHVSADVHVTPECYRESEDPSDAS